MKKKEKNGTNEKRESLSSSELVKKLRDYFNTEPQRIKVLSQEDFNAAGDTYYASVSASYKVAQRILIILLVFFIVISVIANFNEITYDNFHYLIKDFTSASDAGNNTYTTLSYESDSRQNFVLFRGGIATVSPSKISIFTATGRRTLNETSDFSSPFAVSSNRYVLFYDTAGTTFSMYNSFARVYSETLDNPVKCASIADDGSFAVVTKSAKGTWTTRIYTKNFKLKAIVPAKNGSYIFGVDLNSNTEKLSVLSYDAGNGTGRTTLSVYDLSNMKQSKGNEISLEHTFTYDSEFPIVCGYTSNDTFAVVTDSYIRIYDDSFNEKDQTVDYSNGNLTGYSLSSDGVAVSVMRSSGSALFAFDNRGNMVYDANELYNVLDLGVYGDHIFMQTDQGVVRVNTLNGEKQELASGNGKMLIYNEKTVLICGETKAEYLVFNND